MYCLDTNIVIDIFRGNEKIREKLKSLIKLNKPIFITTINLFELYKGAYLSSKSQEALRLIEDFIDSIGILEANKMSCEEFGKEYARLRKIGKLTNEIDLMIASIAKANNCTIITKNRKDFENINIDIEVW